MSFKLAGSLAVAASLLFAAPALAGSTVVYVTNLSGSTATVSGGAGIGLPSSVGNGGTVSGTSSFSSGQPDSGVLTVSSGSKMCSFSWSRPGQQVKNGPLCGTLTSFSTPLGAGSCPNVVLTQQPSPTCTGGVKFTIQ